MPGQFGPINRASARRANARISIVSWTGTNSASTITDRTPASMASNAAPLTNRAGTKMTDRSMGCASSASTTVEYTGTPATSWPPLPGVQPATTDVPLANICSVQYVPSLPVIPWTSTLGFDEIIGPLRCWLQRGQHWRWLRAPRRPWSRGVRCQARRARVVAPVPRRCHGCRTTR